MKTQMRTLLVLLVAGAVTVGGLAQSVEGKEDKKLERAKDTVDRIREPDPPKVSTETKPSPIGLPTEEFKPKGPSVHPKEPPPPPPSTKDSRKK
jgi:hypothetical protein